MQKGKSDGADTPWEKGNRKVARLKKICAVYTGRRGRTGIAALFQ